MAWTDFYIQSTGGTPSDVNAGSTTTAAAVSVANASWDVTADTYIGLTGIEFAAVSVGDWASIYLDAATVAVYIAQVVSVGALGVSITLSTTAKYGTKPTAGATGRSCKVGGPHLSELPWASGGLTGTVPASTRVNWKQATYTIVASRTFSLAGTTTAPLWFRGYNTTRGDGDANPALTRPLLSFNATFAAACSGDNQLWSSINFIGARSLFIMSCASTNGRFVRCRIENTSANSGAQALSTLTNQTTYSYCYFKCPATAIAVIGNGIAANFIGVVVDGGGASISTSTLFLVVMNSVLINNTNSILASTGAVRSFFNSSYNSSGDAIKWTGTPGLGSMVIGTLCCNVGGFGINNASGANTNIVFRACNDFFSCTSGNENGFGDSPSFFEQNEIASPFVNATTDLTLAAAALARQTGYAPGGVENETYTSYISIGAVQPTSAGKLLTHPGMSGGMRG